MIIALYIIFLSFIILCHIFSLPTLEGIDETCKLNEDPLYLAKENARKINSISEKLEDFEKMQEDVENNKIGITAINEEITGAGSELTDGLQPGDPIPEASGLDLE